MGDELKLIGRTNPDGERIESDADDRHYRLENGVAVALALAAPRLSDSPSRRWRPKSARVSDE